MKRKIYLRIGTTFGGTVADLGEDSFVLLNWSNGDLTEPAQIKNSWSRQITLPGTPTNDNIFGQAWRLDRATAYGIPGDGGIYFDASYRTPFTIYDDASSIIEKGYLKLDEVAYDGPHHSYKVTLFGFLGGFLYSLAHNADGSRKTLADLVYKAHDGSTVDLGFNISKDTVAEAWDFLAANTDPHYLAANKWDFINFSPAYNGFPTGTFSPDKAIVNVQDAGLPFIDGDFSPINGGRTVLVSFPSGKTEWETRDLRSYLQRPVVRLGAILEAIADPENNGGYDVDLEETFFDPILAANAYVWKTWVTLPLLTQYKLERESAAGSLAFVVGQNTIPTVFGDPASFDVTLAPKIGAGSAPRYLYCDDAARWINWIEFSVTYYNAAGVKVKTETFRFSSARRSTSYDITNIGYFDAAGNWVGPVAHISWQNPSGIGNELYSRIDVAMSNGGVVQGRGSTRIGYVWTNTSDESTRSTYTASLVSSGTYSTSAVSSVRSFTDVTPEMLLRSDKTPADYLLSFVKLFGLRIVWDPVRERVTILPRYNYFVSRTPLDISALINRSKPMSQTPLSFNKRWYSFGLDYANGEWARSYANQHGRTYGTMRVDTGYQFDASTEDVLAGVHYRGAVQILEHSKYFCKISRNGTYPPSVFLDSGATYELFDGQGNSKQMPVPVPDASVADIQPLNPAHIGFDIFDKPQFHNEENAPYDTRDALVFFAGIVTGLQGQYRISDDGQTMMLLNNNTPCWDLSYGIPLTEIPQFSRYCEADEDGVFTESLDLGTPAEIPVPDILLKSWASIYDRYWRAFISDRLNDDTCVVRCWVNLDGLGQVGQDLLRRFYYFDGAVWSLNKIINYSLTTWDDTECEFVRVQSINNYY